MKKTIVKTAVACGLCLTILTSGLTASAAYTVGVRERAGNQTFNQTQTFWQNGRMNGMNQTQNGAALSTAGAATEIVSGTTTNSAASLKADESNAATYDVSVSGSVKITESGTYIVTGTCSDGTITVKKGTTGVVLILRNLDLTSTTCATLSINKGAEVKLVVEGSVKLTDAEDIANEASDDFDGAAIKVKAGASAYLTGSGTLTVNGSAKNGVKVSADETEGNGSLVIDGATVSITAANDAINAEYDLAILGGTLTISAGDDGIHADRVLTVGGSGGGPTIQITKSNEGIEATVVNLAGGTVNVTASDDGINAANSDGTYQSEMAYAVNITGADVTVNTRADGIDSNGNVNLVSGSATISSANNGGDAGIDYDGSLYISDAFVLNNQSGVTSMGAMGGMMGQMGGMNGMQQPAAPAQNQTQPSDQKTQGNPQAPVQGQPPMQGQQGQFGAQAPAQSENPMQGNMGMNRPFGMRNQMGVQGTNRMPMQGMMGGMNGAPAFGGMGFGFGGMMGG